MATVLITGATSGIGRHTALHLARAGHTVFASGRRVEALSALVAEGGGRVTAVPMDVTRAESIATARAQVLEATQGRGLDALVNNAGFGLVAPLSEITDADLRAQFETNVFGLMAVTRAFLPEMIARRSGRVVNVSSVGGRVTFPLMAAYNATKYAVESLSDGLRMELAPLSVQVSIVEPGAIRTAFNDVAVSTVKAVQGSPYTAVLAQAAETSRRFDAHSVGPETVARAIEHAIVSARPRARYVRPWRTYFLLALHRLLPTRWLDTMMSRQMGLVALGAS